MIDSLQNKDLVRFACLIEGQIIIEKALTGGFTGFKTLMFFILSFSFFFEFIDIIFHKICTGMFCNFFSFILGLVLLFMHLTGFKIG